MKSLRFVVFIALAVVVSCASPVAPGLRSASILLTSPNPTWTGTTTASDGQTGTVTVTFGFSGSVSWTGRTGTFTGTFSVPNPNDGTHITATIAGAGAASACRYAIDGTVVNNSFFSGTYTLSGPCLDRTGRGTFRLFQGL